MPEVSIIVPVFKAENYLDRCIKSIISQSYSDFELILIDDGSPDKCGEICDNYAKLDCRIVVLHKSNSGVSASRNSGLKEAKGKWVCFVDSDDYLDREYLSEMISVGEKNRVDLVVCGYHDSRDETNKAYDKNILLMQRYEILNFIEKARNAEFDYGFLHPVWNKFYRKDMLNECYFNTIISFAN